MTPEEKLCSRTWRLRNSLGVLWSILSFGLLTCVNFLSRGGRSKNKRWIGYGIGFGVIAIGLLATTGTFESGTKEAPVESTAGTVWGWIMIANWIAGTWMSIATNRKWLLWKAHHEDQKWYSQATAAGQNVQSSSAASPTPAPTFSTPAATTPIFHQANHGPTATSDINLMQLPDFERVGFEYGAAQRILEVRQQRGPYQSFEQLVAVTGIPPHLLIPHRNVVSFAGTPEPLKDADGGRSRGSRRLDL